MKTHCDINIDSVTEKIAKHLVMSLYRCLLASVTVSFEMAATAFDFLGENPKFQKQIN